jgi:uncharacterized protein
MKFIFKSTVVLLCARLAPGRNQFFFPVFFRTARLKTRKLRTWNLRARKTPGTPAQTEKGKAMPDTAPPPPIPTPNESQARTWNMLCHLSVLAGFVIPFGNFIGPLLVWQIKKHEFPSVEAHGKAALNFQFTVFLAMLVGGTGAFVLSFVCVGLLLIPILVAIGLCGLIFAILAGVKANDGKDWQYPLSLKLIN